jgi:hypothetical protein
VAKTEVRARSLSAESSAKKSVILSGTSATSSSARPISLAPGRPISPIDRKKPVRKRSLKPSKDFDISSAFGWLPTSTPKTSGPRSGFRFTSPNT